MGVGDPQLSLGVAESFVSTYAMGTRPPVSGTVAEMTTRAVAGRTWVGGGGGGERDGVGAAVREADADGAFVRVADVETVTVRDAVTARAATTSRDGVAPDADLRTRSTMRAT